MEYREHRRRGEITKMHSLMGRYLSLLTPTSANRCDPCNEARASDLALFSSGKIFQKKHRIIPATLFTTQCLASPPPWNWHVGLPVGTTPPWQVAWTLFARATQWASDSLSKSWSQLSSASPQRMKEVRHCRAKIQSHSGEMETCRNQRNTKAEKREHTWILLSQSSWQGPQIQKQEAYTMWLPQLTYFF